MGKQDIAVRTIYLQKFFDPGSEMVAARQNPQNREGLIKAMRRLDLADKTLEQELKPFADKGFTISALLQHPNKNAEDHDLLITLILTKDSDN